MRHGVGQDNPYLSSPVSKISAAHLHELYLALCRTKLTVGDIRDFTGDPELPGLLQMLIDIQNSIGYLQHQAESSGKADQEALDDSCVFLADDLGEQLVDIATTFHKKLTIALMAFKAELVRHFAQGDCSHSDFVVEQLGTSFFTKEQEQTVLDALVKDHQDDLLYLVELHDKGYLRTVGLRDSFKAHVRSLAEGLAKNFKPAPIGYREEDTATGYLIAVDHFDEKDPALVKQRYLEAVAIYESACLRHFFGLQDDSYTALVFEAMLDGFWQHRPTYSLGMLGEGGAVSRLREVDDTNHTLYKRAAELVQRVIDECSSTPTLNPIAGRASERNTWKKFFQSILELYPDIKLPEKFQSYLSL